MASAFSTSDVDALKRMAGELPPGHITGIIGAENCGAEEILAAARAESGGEVLALNQPLAGRDALAREREILGWIAARRRGAAVLLYSHDEALLERICDEVWWVDGGRLAHRGTAKETLAHYRRHVARRLAAVSPVAEMSPVFRRGDGRAEILAIETLAIEDRPVGVWMSGEPAAVRIAVRFHAAVESPVIGMLIRTRVGLDVFGTNTELEGIGLGPVAAGEALEVIFRFRCDLCPQEYTITAASHDPDGVWHDWMDEAIAVSVADTRYTAGVANLRATVETKRL